MDRRGWGFLRPWRPRRSLQKRASRDHPRAEGPSYSASLLAGHPCPAPKSKTSDTRGNTGSVSPDRDRETYFADSARVPDKRRREQHALAHPNPHASFVSSPSPLRSEDEKPVEARGKRTKPP